MTATSEGGDGLLRLAYALASNNQRNENLDLMKWLETATVDDLRLAFPVLLNWCRNSAKKAAKASAPRVVLTPTIAAEEVAQKIVKVLEEAIEYDAAEKIVALNLDENEIEKEVERRSIEKKSDSISSLRMALAGYLHTNHAKMRKVPIVAELERRTKAKVAADRAATNMLNMVNAASPSPMSVSQYITPEDESASSRGWGIPHINIDLGLGLQQTSPADVCKEFIRDKKPLKHPFTGETVGYMEVKKVFPSKRKPVWIEYFSSDGLALKPDVLAKQGDDLRNDASVTTVSNLCEAIWAKAGIQWTLGVPPTVCAYDVLVTDTDAGYLEMVPGKNFLDLSQPTTTTTTSSSSSSSNNNNNKTTGWEGVNVRKLAPSLVGSYIVNFILGVRDRHEDNMMVVGDLKEDPKMMQIDFGYVLMEFPGGVHFDMPRLTMPIDLVDRFNSEPGRGSRGRGVTGSESSDNSTTTLMEDLQHDMLAAYLVLRHHSNQLIPFCAHLMSSSYSYKQVESILRGRHVFRTDQAESKVIKWMSQKLTKQWAHFYFRREVKQGMVSGYYKFVETMTFENNKDKDKNGAAGNNNKVVSIEKLRGKIKSFFTTQTDNRKSASTTMARGGGSEEDSYSDKKEDEEDGEEDNQSHHSEPEVFTPIHTSDDGQQEQQQTQQQPVFKKSRSQTKFVFDLSAINDDGEISSSPAQIEAIDMSKLNERVNTAMKLQKEVSKTMISQKEKHGTLKLGDLDGDDEIAAVNSI
jgi:hypothetical protein